MMNWSYQFYSLWPSFICYLFIQQLFMALLIDTMLVIRWRYKCKSDMTPGFKEISVYGLVGQQSTETWYCHEGSDSVPVLPSLGTQPTEVPGWSWETPWRKWCFLSFSFLLHPFLHPLKKIGVKPTYYSFLKKSNAEVKSKSSCATHPNPAPVSLLNNNYL